MVSLMAVISSSVYLEGRGGSCSAARVRFSAWDWMTEEKEEEEEDGR